jgi:hypothetical protein
MVAQLCAMSGVLVAPHPEVGRRNRRVRDHMAATLHGSGEDEAVRRARRSTSTSQ